LPLREPRCRKLTNARRKAYAAPVSDDDDDKRNHPRTPIELKVEYKKMNTFFADYTKNISKGGTFIKTDRPLPVGTEFLFKLSLPKRENPFELKGAVIWTNQPSEVQKPDNPNMGMGIRFIFDTPDDRDRFESEVEDLMVASLGPYLYTKLVGRPVRNKN
jgi:type IV pilus assembly protein PilZ